VLLSVLRRQARYSFSWIVTGDESWFLYWYPADHMFASSRDEVIPRTKGTIGAHKVMMTVSFSGLHLVTLKALPPGTWFNQEYFIDENLPISGNSNGLIHGGCNARILAELGFWSNPYRLWSSWFSRMSCNESNRSWSGLMWLDLIQIHSG
jgi:hypothetical protein